jgi:hypothetical protein
VIEHRLYRRWILLAIAWLPVVPPLALWHRSYAIWDTFSRFSETARWPNGSQRAAELGELIHNGWHREGPIYNYQSVNIESGAGGIVFQFSSGNIDLSDSRIFDQIRHSSAGRIYDSTPYVARWRHSETPVGRWTPYPQLKVPGDNPTWDIRFKSTGDLKSQHETGTLFEFVIPYWGLVLVTSLPGLLMLAILFRRFRRWSRNLCTHCGYDLRATPDRCPECGAIPAKHRPKSSEPHAA